MNLVIHNMFTEYFVIDKLNLDLLKINEYCYDREKIEKGNIMSNVGGWQSSDISNDSELFIQELKNKILNRVKKICEYTGRHSNLNYNVANMWIMLNRKNHFNLPHAHPSSCFSGVFYVKCNENSGNLVFIRPDKTFLWAFDIDAVKEYSQYTSQTYTVPLEENCLVIFPSHQEHYVKPNLSDTDRISISFNVIIKKG